MFSINLYDYSVSFIYSGFQGTSLKPSENNKVFLIQKDKNVPILFFQLNKYCTGKNFYHISQKSCVVCDNNCAECLSTTACKDCLVNSTLINGSCKPCGSN
jgi:hypothetical protein